MEGYTTSQWLLFFYLYCFAGWIWESCYVSAKKKQWVNRGFMHGPFLPIYGSGAIVILLVTIPVKHNLFLVFISGMISATILEFCTGACMEKLFHVRYWDYSDKFLNIKGHTCLTASLGWGIASILMIRFVHPPVSELVVRVPGMIVDIIAFVLTAGVAVDFTQSFNEAMDLRATLTKLSESNEQLRRLEKRIEVVAAFAEDSYEKRKEGKEVQKQSRRKRFEENLRRQREEKTAKLLELENQAKAYFQKKQVDIQESTNYMRLLDREKERMGGRTDKEYRRLSRILRRNPDAVSMEHKDELSEIKDMMEMKK